MQRRALLFLVILLTSAAFAASHQAAPDSSLLAPDALKPRVYLMAQSKGSNQNAARDQSMEMSKDFEEVCPSVRITINQAMADYTVVLNHIEVGLFVRDNQFQLADHNGDLISKTKEGGSIMGGVKKVCNLITQNWVTTRAQAAALAAQGAAAASASDAQPAAPVQMAAVQAPPVQAAQFVISSNPTGADIEIDGGFVGDTPSNVDLPPGEHMIAIHKKNFQDWQRKVKVTGGSITLNANLEPLAN